MRLWFGLKYIFGKFLCCKNPSKKPVSFLYCIPNIIFKWKLITDRCYTSWMTAIHDVIITRYSVTFSSVLSKSFKNWLHDVIITSQMVIIWNSLTVAIRCQIAVIFLYCYFLLSTFALYKRHHRPNLKVNRCLTVVPKMGLLGSIDRCYSIMTCK